MIPSTPLGPYAGYVTMYYTRYYIYVVYDMFSVCVFVTVFRENRGDGP